VKYDICIGAGHPKNNTPGRGGLLYYTILMLYSMLCNHIQYLTLIAHDYFTLNNIYI